MFGVLRILLGLIVTCPIAIYNFKKGRKNKKNYFIICLIFMIIVTGTAFLPMENHLITFSSPESVFEYMQFGPTEVVLNVKGDKSNYLVGKGENASFNLIIPKTEKGWKIGLPLQIKTVQKKYIDGFRIDVFLHTKTGDHYIRVKEYTQSITSIFDNYDSEFISTTENIGTFGKTYYAYLSKYTSGYILSINGHSVSINQGTVPCL